MKRKLLTTAVAVSVLLSSTIAGAVTGVQEFTDYPTLQAHWGLKDINYLVSLGAINGVPDGTGFRFDADRNISRSEFTAILVRLLDPTGEKSKVALYNTDSDYAPTVADMQAKGFTWDADILTVASYYGVTMIANEIKSEWDKPVTRDEMAFLAINLDMNMNDKKYEKLQGIEKLVTDNDIVKKNLYSQSIYLAYSNGILGGDENGNYNPSNNATRAEACAILSRLTDQSRRLQVNIPETPKKPSSGSSSSVVDGVSTTTLYQSDPYRRSVQEGDIFIDNNGKEWVVYKDPISGTFNPADPVGFDLGRIDSLGDVVKEYYDSDGTMAILGSGYYTAPNGHMGFKEEFIAIAKSGYDKPTTPGTYDGELSPNKYWKWYESDEEMLAMGFESHWVFNMNVL